MSRYFEPDFEIIVPNLNSVPLWSQKQPLLMMSASLMLKPIVKMPDGPPLIFVLSHKKQQELDKTTMARLLNGLCFTFSLLQSFESKKVQKSVRVKIKDDLEIRCDYLELVFGSR